MNTAAATNANGPARSDKPLSRRWATLAFAASSLATAGLAVVGGHATKLLDDTRSERRADYDRFRTASDGTDRLFRDYMTVYLRTAPVDQTGRSITPLPFDAPRIVAAREALERNVLEQNTAVEQIAMHLDKGDAKLSRHYLDQMTILADALDDPVPAQEAKRLMQADADARDTRNDVLTMLQRRADRWF